MDNTNRIASVRVSLGARLLDDADVLQRAQAREAGRQAGYGRWTASAASASYEAGSGGCAVEDLTEDEVLFGADEDFDFDIVEDVSTRSQGSYNRDSELDAGGFDDGGWVSLRPVGSSNRPDDF
jgi:hypothetical protein